jgi:hypothetical protein
MLHISASDERGGHQRTGQTHLQSVDQCHPENSGLLLLLSWLGSRVGH